MSLKDVLNRFTLVSGFERDRVSHYLPIILDCIRIFQEKIQHNNFSETDMLRLTHACAVFAYYKVSLCMGSEAFTSFKAGDVEFDVENIKQSALSIWQSEKAQIADLLGNDDFSFMRVEV